MKLTDFKATEPLRRAPIALFVLCALCVITFGQNRVGQPLLPGNSLTQTQQNVGSATGVTQDASVADKWTTVYGAKIHYLEAGSGPAVILIHGLGGNTTNWTPTIAPLAQKYRVLVPDQIGFGKSDKPMLNYRVGTLVDFLDGFYKQVGIQKASLVGNSLGGFTAAAYAIAHPEKVDKLVLVDAAGFRVTGDIDPKVLNGLNPSTKQQIKDLLGLVFYNKETFASDAAIEGFLASRVTAGDQYTIQRFIDSIGRR